MRVHPIMVLELSAMGVPPPSWRCLSWGSLYSIASYKDSIPTLEPPTQFGPEPYSSPYTPGPHLRARRSTQHFRTDI